MQNYEKIAITPDQIIPIARDMRDRGIMLTMIHGYVDHDGKPSSPTTMHRATQSNPIPSQALTRCPALQISTAKLQHGRNWNYMS